MAIGTEDQALGTVEAAAVDEDIDERAGRAVEAHHFVRLTAADVEVAVGAEDETRGVFEPASGGEDADELARRPVVAQHGIAATGDVEVTIRPEGQALRVIEPAAGGENVYELALLGHVIARTLSLSPLLTSSVGIA